MGRCAGSVPIDSAARIDNQRYGRLPPLPRRLDRPEANGRGRDAPSCKELQLRADKHCVYTLVACCIRRWSGGACSVLVPTEARRSMRSQMMLQGGVEGHAALDKAHGHSCTRNTSDTGDERSDGSRSRVADKVERWITRVDTESRYGASVDGFFPRQAGPS